MSNKLRYWVRLDSKHTPVGGSNIARKNKPKSGNWQEILKETCCGPEITDEDVDVTLTGVNVVITCSTGNTFTVDLEDTTTTTMAELIIALNSQLGYVGTFWASGADVVLKVSSDFYNNFCPEGILTLAISQSV